MSRDKDLPTSDDVRAIAPAVRVKPLVWRESPSKTWYRALGPLTHYEIGFDEYAENWQMTTLNKLERQWPWEHTITRHASLDDAKAVAQADHERRILAALEPAPAPTLAEALKVPEVKALVEAAKSARIILARHEPLPCPVLTSILTALAAVEGGE